MSDYSTTAPPPEATPAVGQASRNGATDGAAQPITPAAATSNGISSATAEPTSATSEADRIVDKLAVNIAVTTSSIGRGLLRFVARSKEELSDIWAEAQSLRHGDKK
jgi:hypothetical protein